MLRGSIALLWVATGLGMTIGVSRVQAEGNCRYECDLTLQQCRQSCVDAQNFDDCTSSCDGLYQQCLLGCE